MASLFDMTRNFSFYTVPAAWVLCFVPHFYAVSVHDSASPDKKFDIQLPRGLVPSLEQNQSLDTATKNAIARAEAAQENGFENLGLFAAAVVAANVAKVDSWWLNALSGGYLASRLLYNVIYIRGMAGHVRTGVFLSGVGMIFTMFVKAGNLTRNTVL